MQSSAVVTIRALVMLLFLVALPLAAVFGTGLPAMFNSVVQGKGLPGITTRRESEDLRSQGGEAPIFAAAPPTTAPAEPQPKVRGTGSLWAPGVPTGIPTPSIPGGPAAVDNSKMPPGLAAPAPPANAGDQFAQLERRLRDLGATYYRLETSGTTGLEYRFHCTVATVADPSQVQPFTATDEAPLRAMQRVLEQVEHYRASPRP